MHTDLNLDPRQAIGGSFFKVNRKSGEKTPASGQNFRGNLRGKKSPEFPNYSAIGICRFLSEQRSCTYFLQRWGSDGVGSGGNQNSRIGTNTGIAQDVCKLSCPRLPSSLFLMHGFFVLVSQRIFSCLWLTGKQWHFSFSVWDASDQEHKVSGSEKCGKSLDCDLANSHASLCSLLSFF